jgi:hypothetical protein
MIEVNAGFTLTKVMLLMKQRFCRLEKSLILSQSLLTNLLNAFPRLLSLDLMQRSSTAKFSHL